MSFASNEPVRLDAISRLVASAVQALPRRKSR
jgi:hypothetical protein